MDFFQQQDIARRNSRLLVVLFVLAVLALIVLTNAAFAAFLYFGQHGNVYSGYRGASGFLSYFSWARFGGIGLAITGTVAAVALAHWVRLSRGGRVVAEGLGGTRILPQTEDPLERRCLNVVEELALAANMPVPPVYVLNDERGINAFAAGVVPADAVVAVTRGALEQFKRHELQGVIGHEFSHILNGDIRLNVRLAALLKGITFIGDAGHLLLRSDGPRTGQSHRGPLLPVFGLALWLLGLAGALAAGFIKAAISRQKEYLADAGAVQFTRSTDGIGDALKVIGGYIPGTLVHAARAAELSHIFFGEITHRLWQVFTTHPPLASRIARIDPHWDGRYIERRPNRYELRAARPGDGEIGVGRAALVAAAAANAYASDASATGQPDDPVAFSGSAPTTGAPSPRDALSPADVPQALREPSLRDPLSPADIPPVLREHSRDPLGAQSLVCALLLDAGPALRQRQLTAVADSGITGLETLTHTLHPAVQALGPPHRLPLLELCLPALKLMSAAQYRAFRDLLPALIRADQRVDVHEWCLYQLLRHYLDPEFVTVQRSRPRYTSLAQVAAPLRVALAVMAGAGHGDTEQAFRAAADSLDMPQLTLPAPAEAGVAAFGRAVRQLADCYPLLKPRVLKALALAATGDGRIEPLEREILASVAAVMDCPLPAGFDG